MLKELTREESIVFTRFDYEYYSKINNLILLLNYDPFDMEVFEKEIYESIYNEALKTLVNKSIWRYEVLKRNGFNGAKAEIVRDKNDILTYYLKGQDEKDK